MATEQDGVVQLIRMVLDEQAAKKLEQDMQESLKKGTDPKTPVKNTKEIDNQFERLGKTIRRVVEYMIARAVVNFGREAVAAALEARLEWSLLEKAVANTGISYKQIEGRIHQVSSAFQEAGIAGEEEFAGALRTLVQISGDADKSLRNMSVVADFAAARNMDLGAAAEIVAKAMNGQVTMLQRLGIEIPKGADAVAILAEQFRGSAAAVDPAVRAQKTLVETWGDLKEAIGEAILSVEGGDSIIQGIINTIKSFTRVIAQNHEGISILGKTMWWLVKGAGAVILGLFSGLSSVVGYATKAFIAFTDAIAWTLRLLGISTPQYDANKKSLLEFADGALKAADAADKLARSIIDPNSGDPLANDNPLAGKGGGGGIGGALKGAKGEEKEKSPEELAREAEEAMQRRINAARDALEFDDLRAEGMMKLIELEAELSEKLNDGTLSFEERVQAQKNLKDVQSALIDGMKGMAAQAGFTQEALDAMWEGNWKAAFKSVAKEASISAAWNLAKASEEFARAWGWIGLGNFASAGAAKASAAGHLATAGKWAALAGTAGAAGSGGGGGSGGSAGSTAGQLGGDAAGKTQAAGVQVTVWVDGFDPDNTRHQDRIHAAAQDIRERYGEDSFIDIKKWSK